MRCSAPGKKQNKKPQLHGFCFAIMIPEMLANKENK
jgi:hypothetical protein